MSSTFDMSAVRSFAPFATHASQTPRPTWKRWLGIGEPDKALLEIESLLASCLPAVPSAGELSQSLSAFGVSASEAKELFAVLYCRALAQAVKDDVIEAQEEQYLIMLRAALGVSSKDLGQIEQELLHPRFTAEVKSAISDDILSGGDKLRLEKVMQQLRLSPETAKKLYEIEGQARVDLAISTVTADGRLSVDEDTALRDLARNLGASLSVDAATRDVMERMRLLWRIDNGELPSVTVPIALQKGEVCHARLDAEWFEQRTRTKTVAYSGFSTSIRICKGVRYRVGTVSPVRVTTHETVVVDRGVLYLTNKRLIFDGAQKNTTMRLSTLLGFVPFADGVQLEKSSGRPLMLKLGGGDIELFHSMLSAVLSNAE